MAHMTAGDIDCIFRYTNNTGTGTPIYYGDIAEGGKITPLDTCNPYVSWRVGDKRKFSKGNYVTRQKDAGFQAIYEVRDIANWKMPFGLAGAPVDGVDGHATQHSMLIGGRFTNNNVKHNRLYCHCATDQLTLSADEPGGIVKFEETILAGYAEETNITTSTLTPSGGAAVQWLGGATIKDTDNNTTTIYPQSFKLSINNNVERVRVPGTAEAITGDFIFGKMDCMLDLDIWMADFAYMFAAQDNDKSISTITLRLGIEYPANVSLIGVVWMDSNPDLVQDKQRQTLHFRGTHVEVNTPA